MKRSVKKKKTISSILIFFSLISLFSIALIYSESTKIVYKAYTDPKIYDVFQGTFTTKDNPFCYIIIKASKEFFYVDDRQDIYFNGIVSKGASNYYQLSSEYFGEQTIYFEDLCFEFVLDGEKYVFKKISNHEMINKNLKKY